MYQLKLATDMIRAKLVEVAMCLPMGLVGHSVHSAFWTFAPVIGPAYTPCYVVWVLREIFAFDLFFYSGYVHAIQICSRLI